MDQLTKASLACQMTPYLSPAFFAPGSGSSLRGVGWGTALDPVWGRTLHLLHTYHYPPTLSHLHLGPAHGLPSNQELVLGARSPVGSAGSLLSPNM